MLIADCFPMNAQESNGSFAMVHLLYGATLQVTHLKAQVKNLRHIKGGDMSPHSKTSGHETDLLRTNQQSAVINQQLIQHDQT
jgi:hypothetical protein